MLTCSSVCVSVWPIEEKDLDLEGALVTMCDPAKGNRNMDKDALHSGETDLHTDAGSALCLAAAAHSRGACSPHVVTNAS